ncbi:DUF6113 family protein [Streptosporangium sp. NPDC050855]|uniref:DUF6113 family protein n=1 Tax=Streptosporangium sp. NPDC050855 TaxID=3366194 RepID=UPI0037897F6D
MEQVPVVRSPSETVVTVAACAVLAVLGFLVGLLCGFQHSWSVGAVPVPVSALGCVALLFAISYGAGRMARGKSVSLAFAAGWTLITVIWAAGRPEGDLVIADDVAGYVYLYGGLVAITAGVLLAPSAGGGSWLLTQHGYGPRPSAAPGASTPPLPPPPPPPPAPAPPGAPAVS